MKTRKTIMTLVLLAMGFAGSVQAQTYSVFNFDASAWTVAVGSGTTTDGKITATEYKWGCFEIQYRSSFSIPTGATRLVVTGENFTQDASNNTNLYKFNGTDNLKLMPTSLTSTEIVYDLTTRLPAATGGYYDISSADNATLTFALLFSGSADPKPVITDIRFEYVDNAFTYNASSNFWGFACGNGTFDESAGTITATSYSWGVFEPYYNQVFSIPEGYSKVVVKGQNFKTDNNTKLHKFNGAQIALAPSSVSADGTMMVYDIASVLPTAVGGKHYISGAGQGNNAMKYNLSFWFPNNDPVISSIAFVPTYTLEMSQTAGVSTFVAPFEVTLPANVEAYQVESKGTDYITLKKVADGGATLAANTPVILKATETLGSKISQDYYDEPTGTENANTDGFLTGCYSATTLPSDVYILQWNGSSAEFRKVTSDITSTKGRCYLILPNESRSSLRAIFSGDETTGIESIEHSTLNIEHSVYDIQGRRMESSMFNIQSSMLKKGLYIVNGKKTILK